MNITDLFSIRQKQLNGGVPDVFQYTIIPDSLRVQFVHILDDVIGNQAEYARNCGMVRTVYKVIVEKLRREYGVFYLTEDASYRHEDHRAELHTFILTESSVERVLDAIELSLRCTSGIVMGYSYRNKTPVPNLFPNAVEEINERFKRQGVGYRFENGKVVRIDSELIHAEVVQPALFLLQDSKYAGAEDEFRRAFEHYRHGRAKEALVDALKSIESVMKNIAERRNWPVRETPTAKALFSLMIEKELVPSYWTSHFSGLRSMLEAGVPTVRNREGGHGQGASVVEVPAYLVAFALHQTAATIVFLVTAEKALS